MCPLMGVELRDSRTMEICQDAYDEALTVLFKEAIHARRHF